MARNRFDKKAMMASFQRVRLSGMSRQAMEMIIFERDGGCCCYCGVPLCISGKGKFFPGTNYPLPAATIEHVRPVSKGGKNNLENLRLCCQECNKARGNKPLSRESLRKLGIASGS